MGLFLVGFEWFVFGVEELGDEGVIEFFDCFCCRDVDCGCYCDFYDFVEFCCK